MSMSIRKSAAAVLVAGVAAISAANVSSASAAVASPQLSNAHRSVQASVTNNTHCTWTKVDESLSHGVWATEPEDNVFAATMWESESDGIATGTEGDVTYRLGGCADPAQNTKFVRFHWDNPYAGSNSYDTFGSSAGVHAVRSGGSGDNAIVNWVVTVS